MRTIALFLLTSTSFASAQDQPAITQAAVADKIKKIGGFVRLEETKLGKSVTSVTLLDKTTDSDLKLVALCKDLKELQVFSTHVTDVGLSKLSGLSQLRLLEFISHKITDAGVRHLDGLSQIQTLSLYDANISDKGLARLNKLTALRHLRLGKTKITGVGIAKLTDLKQLKTLSLYHSGITDADLAPIKVFPQLESLNLSGCRIGGEGLVHLAALKKLINLNLSKTEITDKGLEPIKHLQQVQILDLSENPITDAGLIHLESLKKLKNLGLRRTLASGIGVKKLKLVLPNCWPVGVSENVTTLDASTFRFSGHGITFTFPKKWSHFHDGRRENLWLSTHGQQQVGFNCCKKVFQTDALLRFAHNGVKEVYAERKLLVANSESKCQRTILGMDRKGLALKFQLTPKVQCKLETYVFDLAMPKRQITIRIKTYSDDDGSNAAIVSKIIASLKETDGK